MAKKAANATTERQTQKGAGKVETAASVIAGATGYSEAKSKRVAETLKLSLAQLVALRDAGKLRSKIGVI